MMEESYYTENADEVWEYLYEHPHLLGILAEARPVIARHFPDARVVLEVDRDDGEQLIAHICTNQPVEMALQRLDAFDEEWWLDNMDSSLMFTVECSDKNTTRGG